VIVEDNVGVGNAIAACLRRTTWPSRTTGPGARTCVAIVCVRSACHRPGVQRSALGSQRKDLANSW